MAQLISMVCIALSLIVVLPAPAGDPADAQAVIDKAIKATGGEANLGKFRGHTWNEKGTWYGMGEGLPYTGKYAVQFPDQFRMEIENVFTIVISKDKGWVVAGGETKELSKDQLAVQKEGLYFGHVTTLLPLKDKAFTLASLPEIKVDGKVAVGVKVSHKEHKDVSLYFDKASGLLVKSDQRVKAEEQGGKEVMQEAWYTDHKAISGIQVPMKLVIKRDGKQYLEAEHSDLKFAEKLEDKVFAKP